MCHSLRQSAEVEWLSHCSSEQYKSYVMNQSDLGICTSDAGGDSKREVKLGMRYCGARREKFNFANLSVWDKQS